ncbi:MAG: phosphoribosylpyrophosphate synthetase [Elusimicrobia bacterium RIFCSPLOWO2_02_FULL_39_32]|nr:MAG: phosphoribosylpyrophosphate synthetase [Elusimicrobia bacterium GWA2_38_7]OGR79063.1 MAG: phosphoribosylpyrophosphate synthetase [Elusimicrobia bacterium RIFCSPHIGHO2_02_FULL_39_36]OGR92646.1 MAG: phosphoribosylpyrophosphate synthetase [Elusimicrobia bacterium RIFCSPLOWO2_02_FULL_39_32]OGR99291.1 MAG: phosphoribosylpyrophosphate synthetase [Elusimicrobia bacterium RIFCSPLOWO2_12_FULL_39_28]
MRTYNNNTLKIFSGNSNLPLTEEICAILGIPLGRAHVGRFPDGEVEVKIEENVRGYDCFVVQPTSYPANDNLMELLLLMDALRRASADRITAVLPYYGYGRQDRKAEPRVPISAKLVANLIQAAGADRVLTMDLHAGQIQGFFDIPVDHLYANPVIIDYFKRKSFINNEPGTLVIVSPDAGGVERARAFAKRLNGELAIVDKRRISPREAAVMTIVGDVKDKYAILIDDIIDTAGTLCKACEALHRAGAKKIFAGCAHGIFAGPAIERLNQAPIEEIVVTNSVPLKQSKPDYITVLSIANLLAEAIERIHSGSSVSELFV